MRDWKLFRGKSNEWHLYSLYGLEEGASTKPLVWWPSFEEITPHFEIEKSEPNLKYSRVPYLNNFSSFSKPLRFGDPRFPMCQRQKGPTEEGGKRPKVGEKRGKKESNQI